MKIEKRDGSVERRVLTGMIVSSAVVGRVSSRWDGRLFSSEWANLVGGWCVEFYQQAGKAPRKNITSLYEKWAQDCRDEATSKVVADFLESLSDEYEKQGINSGHLVDLAGDHFDRVRLKRITEAVATDLEMGRVKEAKEKMDGWSSVELGGTSYVEPLEDIEFVKSCFLNNEEPDLIVHEGALGRFFNRQLRRGSFVACMAGEKIGKSHFLLDMACEAIKQRRKVVYFEAGDMTKTQVGARLMSKVAQHPVFSPDGKWPMVVKIPTGIKKNKDDPVAEVTFEEVSFDGPLDWKKAWKKCEYLKERKVRSKEPYLRLSCHPNGTLGVTSMQALLDSWKLDGWVPDVVILDYADILAPPKGVREPRDQIDQNWKMLRAMSQKLHCLVVTATQANSESYKAPLLGRQHFSNDKRKYAHVTALLGINTSVSEKNRGVCRYNWIVVREGPYSVQKCVHVGGCLAVNSPNIVSCW